MDFERLMAIGGAIVLRGNVASVLCKILKPVITTSKRIDQLEEFAKNDNEKIKKLESQNKELKEMNIAIIKSCYYILNHMITGNGVDKMTKTRDSLVDLLTDFDFDNKEKDN